MKKLITLILCIATLMSVLSVGVFAAPADEIDTLPFRDDGTYELGDINSDGNMNAIDANVLRRYIIEPETEICIDAADINADGKASAKDVFYIKSFLSGANDIADYKGDRPVYALTIAGNSIADYDIVVPAGTDTETSNAYLSAKIMKTYIRKAAGASLSIVMGETTKAHGIYYHQYEYGTEECNDLGLGMDDFKYKVIDGDLHIYASVRGSMYATYSVLENYLGLRFYNNKYTYAYDKRVADIPADTDVSVTVPYEFRFAGSSVADSNAYYTYYTAIGCNGINIWMGGTQKDGYLCGPRFAIGHSFGYFKAIQSVPMPEGTDLQKQLSDKYVLGNKTEPMNQNWQPCCSTDESYYRMYNGMLELAQMVQTWGANIYTDDNAVKGLYAMSFSINDSLNTCTCMTCSRKIAGGTVKMKGDAEAVKHNLREYSGEYTIGDTDNKRNTTAVTFKEEGISGLFLDFCNRAAREITTEYHGNDFTYGEGGDFTTLRQLDPRIRTVYEVMDLNMIIYDHFVPATVRPESNIQIMYVSHGCYNHVLGSGECGDRKTTLNDSNATDEKSMVEWAKMCNEAGASIWYYSHGVNYACNLAPSPNVTDFYYNAKFVRECGFNGILYEGEYAGKRANFEDLKAYLAAKMAFNPDMTYDEFTAMVKEYMYMFYGDGYEEVYEYMLLQTACGDAAPCWTNNHDRPFDQYEPSAVKKNYEEMRNLILTAIEKAQDSYAEEHCRNLLVSCEFLGLSASYKDMYVNGTADSRKTYEERYTDMYNYIKDNNLPVYSGDVYQLPDEIDFSSDPMTQFISFASWRGVEY